MQRNTRPRPTSLTSGPELSSLFFGFDNNRIRFFVFRYYNFRFFVFRCFDFGYFGIRFFNFRISDFRFFEFGFLTCNSLLFSFTKCGQISLEQTWLVRQIPIWLCTVRRHFCIIHPASILFDRCIISSGCLYEVMYSHRGNEINKGGACRDAYVIN